MAEIPDPIKNTIERYLNALRKNRIPISQAILFGSYAKGRYNEWSDIDIALVSSIFDGNRFTDKRKIREISLAVSSDLEILPYSLQDFTSDDPFVREILETGVSLV